MCPHSSHFSQASAGISSLTRSDVRGLRSFLNQAMRAMEGIGKGTIWERPGGYASPELVTPCHSSAYPDWRDSQATRSAIPIAREHASRNDPPYEKNGSGIPVIGRRLTVIPTFSTIWVKSRPAMPKTHRLE